MEGAAFSASRRFNIQRTGTYTCSARRNQLRGRTLCTRNGFDFAVRVRIGARKDWGSEGSTDSG
eukprot:1593238-Rhodomonas_salina.1